MLGIGLWGWKLSYSIQLNYKSRTNAAVCAAYTSGHSFIEVTTFFTNAYSAPCTKHPGKMGCFWVINSVFHAVFLCLRRRKQCAENKRLTRRFLWTVNSHSYILYFTFSYFFMFILSEFHLLCIKLYILMINSKFSNLEIFIHVNVLWFLG